MAETVIAVYLGPGRDEFGFACSVLENPKTKQRMVAYSAEVWLERVQFLAELMKLTERENNGSKHYPAA